MGRHPVPLVAVIVLAIGPIAFAAAVPPAGTELRGEVLELDRVGQAAAERMFSQAEAAIYFPELGRARLLTRQGDTERPDAWLANGEIEVVSRAEVVFPAGSARTEFVTTLERDYPNFRWNAHGPYILKVPAATALPPVAASGKEPDVRPDAAVFTDSFEPGLSNWTLDNNTLDLYGWGATTCAARTGSRSADAIRGGVNTLGCTDPYAPDVITTMTHKSCEGVAGASQAWVDTWIHVASESGEDTLGFYYADGSGNGYGYAFSGSWSAWFHVVLNLKQWYRVGDVTATSCPKLAIQFRSDESVQPGLGARIDDLTVSTAAPSFLACAITAAPATGTAPLTVNFTSTVSNGSSSTAYLWSFGDSANTTATTSTASFTYTAPGEYRARLRVGEQGVYAYAHRTISVTAPANCTVTCTATVPTAGSPGSAVSFASTATASGCTSAPAWSWNFGDGQTSTEQNPSHTYVQPGTYTWSLTVTSGSAACTRSGSITISSTAAGRKGRAVRHPADPALDSRTIGPAGGTLSGGGFTLTVPAGAFAASASLTLSRVASPRPDSGEVSDRFRVSGLPESLAKDLTVELLLPSSAPPLAPGEKYYISIDAPAYIGHGRTMAPFRLLATVNGSKLSASIPKSWGTLSRAATNSRVVSDGYGSLTTEVLASALTTVETEHFTATVESKRSTRAREILDLLESHFAKLEDSGFSFGCRIASGAFRRIEVCPVAFGTQAGAHLGEHVSRESPCGSGWLLNDYLQITTSYPPTDPLVNWAAGHELFHLLQDMYSPGGAQANLWLKEASSIWYELAIGNPCPSVQNAYVEFPWNGLFNSKKSAVEGGEKPTDLEAHHGYGASYFLWYHSRSLTDPFVFLIWQSIRQGSGEVAAMQSAMGSSNLPDYWAAFARDYFEGNIQGACGAAWSLFPKASITSEASLPRSTRIAVSPLSARSWNLDFQAFSASARLPAVLTATGLADNQSVYLHDARAKADIAELTRQNPKYSIADLNNFKGDVLVVVVTDRNLPAGDPNAQNPTNEVTLTLEPWAGDATLRYTLAVPVPGCPFPDPAATASSYSPQPSMTATWTSSNKFKSSWSISQSGTTQEITVEGTVSADRRTLESFEILDHSLQTTSGGIRNERWLTAVLSGVPARSDWKQTHFVFGPNCNAGECCAGSA
ncbi:MAG TPA: PKD domain-containing protein [Thermoanaerobaculia bacterium]|nr:PKD domain-containing protein [Thermoanaerobaculia bacterium]